MHAQPEIGYLLGEKLEEGRSESEALLALSRAALYSIFKHLLCSRCINV
jgi:hypothetical protein